MNELITKKKALTNLAQILNKSLESQVSEKRFESMDKEKRVTLTNFLASKGTFVDFRLEKSSENFEHFRLITDKQDEISLNALSMICYKDEPQNAKFKDFERRNEPDHFLTGFGMLQGTKALSSTITKHMSKVRAKKDLELILSYMDMDFECIPKKVYVYFPETETDSNGLQTVIAEDADAETLNNTEDKLTILNVKDAFEVTKLSENKKPVFDILKSTYFIELEKDLQDEIVKDLSKDSE